jgi:DNA-directed RNA polymerase specialized sigma24 family protein
MEATAPRLYSRPPRVPVPVDVVAIEHQDIHRDLERWGRWNKERTASRGLASCERLYRKVTSPAATAQEVDERSLELERAVLRVPEPYRTTLRMFYVDNVSPYGICRVFTVRYRAFASWMYAARAMVRPVRL